MLVLSRGCVCVVRRLDERLFPSTVREGGERGFTCVEKLKLLINFIIALVEMDTCVRRVDQSRIAASRERAAKADDETPTTLVEHAIPESCAYPQRTVLYL